MTEVKAPPATPTGQSAEASNGGAQKAPTGQPPGPTQEDIKRLQQQYSGKINDLNRQNAELLNRLKQLETRDLDEDGLKDYRLQELQEEIRRRDAVVQNYEAELAKERLLHRISTKTGIPVDNLRDASDPDEAWERGFEFARKSSSRKKDDDDEEPDPSQAPDLGRGAAKTTMSEWDKQVKEAWDNRDPVLYTRLLRMKPKE